MKNLIFTIGGLTGLVTGVIIAKKAKLKCNAIVAEHNNTVELIDKCYEEHKDTNEYTIDDRKQDILINNTQTTLKMIKIYALPYITMVFSGCVIMRSMFYSIRKIYKYGGV